jgi:molybdopterin-guanine dinucleotide biosynthesis protein A
LPVLRSGRGAVRLVLERMRVRVYAAADARLFTNVNTPDDYAALPALLQGAG